MCKVTQDLQPSFKNYARTTETMTKKKLVLLYSDARAIAEPPHTDVTGIGATVVLPRNPESDDADTTCTRLPVKNAFSSTICAFL